MPFPIGNTAVVLLLAAATVLIKLLYTGLTSPTRHLPGPWYSRFTHYRLKIAVVRGKRSFYIDQLHQKYGSIVRLSPSEVAVADLDAFKEIHRVGSRYLKSNWYQRLVAFPRPGIFTMIEPRQHGGRRKLMARPFSKSYLKENWEPVVRDKVHLCVAKIRDDAMRDTADVYNWWMLLAADVTATLTFGESFGMLEQGRANQFMRVLKKLIISAGVMVELPLLRLLRFVPVPAVQEIFACNDFIFKGADRAVLMARSQTGDKNMFAKILEQQEKDDDQIDDVDVRIEASNLIIAGTDTTGVTLTYLVYAVLQRPELQAALEAEVAQLAEDFTEDDVAALPLLSAVIDETHRLYGAAPSSLPRVVPAGGTTFGGHHIPQGVTVCTQAYTFHRDPKIWSDPLTYNPSRWLPTPSPSSSSTTATSTTTSPTPPEASSPEARLAFHPFGIGARSCVGIHLAKMELRYAVAFFFRMCRGMRLAPTVTPKSMEMENFFLITPKGHRCEVMFGKDGRGEKV